MIHRTFLFSTLLFLGVTLASAQSDFDAGYLPKVVLSNKLTKSSKWINSLEGRQIIFDEVYQFTHSLVDLSSIYALKTAYNQSFNVGYILRFRNSETIHRTFQHYNFIDKWMNIKIGHRVAFEQFYQTKKKTTYRTRYRISVQKSLNGERLDVNEFYIKFGNEYLYDFLHLEVRFTPYLGYQASKKDKIEVGFDYRTQRISSTASENTLWFRTTWYISL